MTLSGWSVRVAERLALPTSDHGVAGSNPAGGEILPEPKRRFIAQSLSCSPFHRLEMTEILSKGRKTLTHPTMLSGCYRKLNAYLYSVLPHWSIMPQTLDMIPHPITLSWHWIDQSYRGAASTIINDFGMSRPWVEPVTSRSTEQTLYRLSYRGR